MAVFRFAEINRLIGEIACSVQCTRLRLHTESVVETRLVFDRSVKGAKRTLIVLLTASKIISFYVQR